MTEFFEWFCFSLILLSTESVYGSTHAVIGDYKELNPKVCGITPLTDGYDDMCFEWNKNSGSELKDARTATYGEAPWVVMIGDTMGLFGESWCTGSLFADKWIITAKHCIKGTEPNEYGIYFGQSSFQSQSLMGNVVKIHPFPKNGTDLALLELNLVWGREYPNITNICLPQANIINKENEYGLNAGWGQVDRDNTPLQMSYKLLLYNFKYTPKSPSEINLNSRSNFTSLLWTRSIDNKAITCEKDTGSPLWQFYNGRAILIGVSSISPELKGNGNCDYPQNSKFLTGFTSVSKNIDWIKKVTQLN